MASEQAEAVKAMLIQFRQQQQDTGEVTLEEMRANMGSFGEFATEPDGVTWEPVDAGGVPAIWAIPDGGAADRAVQYLHGGGYVLGSAEIYKRFTGHLAKAVGCGVLSVDYGLAPENPHPGPVNDGVKVYRWLLDQGYAAEHIAIAGDSAGGGLTLATVLKLADDGLPQPAAAVPLSPWTDMEGLGDSMQANAERDVLLKADELKGMTDLFLGGADPRDPLAAPVHGDYTGVCALYIQVGGDEALLDDARRVADRAGTHGVEVQIDVFPEMQHVFQMAVGNMPEADDAVARIGAYLRPRLDLE
jgi:monoterpene epsilon-lactone hydrolase